MDIDWTVFHAVNAWVATRDWIEDPTTALADLVVPLYALATVGLWFAARPYGRTRWKLASASGLVAAAVALLANQVISHLWDRPRPFVDHPAMTHVLAAPRGDANRGREEGALAAHPGASGSIALPWVRGAPEHGYLDARAANRLSMLGVGSCPGA